MAEESKASAVTFHELHRSLWHRLVDLALAQIGNLHIRPSDRDARERHEKTAIDMRESLEYRFSAVGFHVGLLREYQRRGLEKLAGDFVSGNRDGFDTVYTVRRQQQMMFDAVIFNILAFFDYIGNAIGFSFYGVDSAGAKWKWKRAVQYARDPDGEARKHGARRYSESNIARLVEQIDREWINRLEEYRAELIHYKTDPAGGGHSLNFAEGGQARVSLTITTPPSFTKWVPMPGKERGERVFILEATDWLILQTHTSAFAIVDALATELERDPAPADGGLRITRAR
jgi:hypothetical protein